MQDSVEIIPLGGLGEFGMNCTALRYGSEMVLIDAGMTFPSSALGADLGVDVIVPDITFLRENRDQLRAILLTHGHEDHAGAVSYIVNELPVPVYGSPLTLGLVEARLQERQLRDQVELRTLETRRPFRLGPFTIEALHVTHSFPDSYCFAIQTPVGNLIWSGDFKFDLTPIDRKISGLHHLTEYGNRGVLALFSDSTNSGVPGLSPSESSVYEPLRNLFRRAQRKIVVSCFASSIHRIHIILDLAQEFRRKVTVLGRSLHSNLAVARQLGYLQVPDDLLISPKEASALPSDQLVVLATGSQGEPMSALSRLAVNEVRELEVEPEDLVILSARIIPGNEKLIGNMINHFYRRGALVYDPTSAQVHASGHGFREDLKLMINLTRPQFFVPIHGEFRQLKTHALLAQEQGIPASNVLVIENGDVLRLGPGGAQLAEKVPVGRRFIDEGYLEEVHDMVLRDRLFLSEDGFVVVVLRLDSLSGDLIGEPELVSRGFVSMDDSPQLISSLQEQIRTIVGETPEEERRDEDLFKEILRKRIKKFLRKQTGKRPMILPVTLRI